MRPTFLLAILCWLAAALTLSAADSPAPNFLFRTHMSVELPAENPAPGVSQTLLNQSIPPDTQGAVSCEQQVTAVNGLVRVFDRGRRLLAEDGLYGWWVDHRPADTGNWDRNFFDPRVSYDPLAQRWYFYASSYRDKDSKYGSMAHLAVSQTSDFLGSWKAWDVLITDLGSSYKTKWFDQPRLGFGAGMVAVSVTLQQRPSIFGEPDAGTTDPPGGTALIVLSDLTSQPGGLTGTVTIFNADTFPYSNSGIPYPATTLSSSTQLYLVSVHNYSNGTDALSALRKSGGAVAVGPLRNLHRHPQPLGRLQRHRH